MGLRALFVDFNSYFASVEQQLQPGLRGKPVGVVPVLVDSTCCIAASYEAKRFGVRTGTPVWQARQLCPGIVIIEARPRLYVEWHHHIVEVVESCIHVSQVLSVDEMTCELSGALARRDRSEKLALHLKRTLARQVGEHVRCSIGIAPNTFLAKTATELQKPDGLVVIEESDLPHCLHVLQLRDLCGIGARMHKRLRSRGIYTVEELCAARRETLRVVWNGIEGDRMWAQLRGEEVWRPAQKKSCLGHSHVLPPEERTPEMARAVLCRLLQKAAMRLRKMCYQARGLHVFVKFLGGGAWSQATKFKESDDTLFFVEVFAWLWQKCDLGHCASEFVPNFEYSKFGLRARNATSESTAKPLAVGVTLFNIKPLEFCTRSLFDVEERRNLNSAIDDMNVAFGKNTIYPGGAHGALHAAPEKIAFGRIPEISEEEDQAQHKALKNAETRLKTQHVKEINQEHQVEKCAYEQARSKQQNCSQKQHPSLRLF